MTHTQIPGSQQSDKSDGQHQPPASHQHMYETDFVTWAEKMAELLQTRRFDELDLVNLVDEVQDLSRRERSALCSNLEIVLIHLLKWQFQPHLRTGSWRGSIREHRRRISKALQTSPSLKQDLEQEFEDCYHHARLIAADETGLKITTFPSVCLYSAKQVLDDEFWPEP